MMHAGARCCSREPSLPLALQYRSLSQIVVRVASPEARVGIL